MPTDSFLNLIAGALIERNKMNKRNILTPEEQVLEEEKRKELTRIRKKFRAGCVQFANVFLGCGVNTLRAYEGGDGRRVSDSVLRLARVWEKFLDDMTAERNK